MHHQRTHTYTDSATAWRPR